MAVSNCILVLAAMLHDEFLSSDVAAKNKMYFDDAKRYLFLLKRSSIVANCNPFT